MERQNLGDLNIRIIRLDRLERPANLGGRVRFHVERIQLTGSAQIENHDAGLVILGFVHCAEGLERGEFGQTEADGPEGADLQEIAARYSVASGDRAVGSEFQHGSGSRDIALARYSRRKI